MTAEIYPLFDRMLARSDKEKLLRQRGIVVWITGLSGSGKSTLALALEQRLHAEGFLTCLLDGDNLRAGLNQNLGFDTAGREENIRRTAEAAKLFLDCGLICLCCTISPLQVFRDQARQIIGSADFAEVFVNTPLEICEQRDVKGLYRKARAGEITGFTGVDAPFETPAQPDLELHTDKKSIAENVEDLYRFLAPKITF